MNPNNSFLKLVKILFCLFLFCMSSPTFSNTGHFYLGGTLGASNMSLSSTNYAITYYNGLLNDQYPLNQKSIHATSIGFNAGYEFKGKNTFPAIALGLGIYPNEGNHYYHGQVIETALGDPSSTLYNYNYQVSTGRTMLETRFTWTIGQNLLPFIDMGIGLGRTRVSGYAETPVDSIGYVPVPPFQSKSKVQFAYQLGIGMGYKFNFMNQTPANDPHEQVGLGFRYINLGNASFGTRGVQYPYPLKLGKATIQELYLSYIHFF